VREPPGCFVVVRVVTSDRVPIVSKLVVAVHCERSPRPVFLKGKQGGVLHPERTLERRAIPPGGPGLRRATRVSWRVTLFVVK